MYTSDNTKIQINGTAGCIGNCQYCYEYCCPSRNVYAYNVSYTYETERIRTLENKIIELEAKLKVMDDIIDKLIGVRG